MRWNYKIFGLLYLSIASGIIIYAISSPYMIVDSSLTSSDPKVAAFYYNWYSNDTDFSQTLPYVIEDDAVWRHWTGCNWFPPNNACSTFTPRFGWYDSSDPNVMEQNLLEAEDAGIDAFICSYWGSGGFEFRNIKNLMRAAKYLNSNVSISLYFESTMVNVSAIGETAAKSMILNDFYEMYDFMTNDTYADYLWYEDGKPVIFAYVVQTIPASVWTHVVTTLENEGKSFFLVGDRTGSSSDYNQNFEAVHQYDVYAPTYRGQYMNDFLNHKIICSNYDQLFVAGVAPGYDDHFVREGNPPLSREDGQTYTKSWQNALALNPDWITITSWNEWHEGTEIAPSVENDDLALNQTKDYIAEFKSGEYVELTPASFYFSLIMHSVIALVLTWVILLLQKLWNRKIIEVDKRLKLGWSVLCLLVGIAAIGYFTVAEVILNDPFEVSSTYWMYLLPGASIFTFASFRMLSEIREDALKKRVS